VDQSGIKVIVGDEHFLFRRGISSLLERSKGIRVIGEAATAEAVVGAVQTHAPDLALLDAALSGENFGLVKTLRRLRPHTNVLLLVDHPNVSAAELASEAGAIGYVARDASPAQMVEAIRRAAVYAAGDAGAPHEQPKAGNSAAQDFRSTLTRREREVLDMVIQGASSREIAASLALSVKTVEAHKFNLMRKLDVHSRSELMQLALRSQIGIPSVSLR
jgi:DNA-binding NarL/FixJ family response regulator